MVITTQPDLIINQYVVSSALIGHIRPTCHPAVNIGKKKIRDPKVILCSRGDCCAKTQIDSKLNNFPPNIHSCALFPKNYLRIPTFLPLFCNWNPAVLSFPINQFCLQTNKWWILFVLLATIALFLAAFLWYPWMLYSRYLAVCHRHLVKRHISINLKYKTSVLLELEDHQGNKWPRRRGKIRDPRLLWV